MGGNLYYLVKLLPVILLTAALFSCLGWWLRGRIAARPVEPGNNRRRTRAQAVAPPAARSSIQDDVEPVVEEAPEAGEPEIQEIAAEGGDSPDESEKTAAEEKTEEETPPEDDAEGTREDEPDVEEEQDISEEKAEEDKTVVEEEPPAKAAIEEPEEEKTPPDPFAHASELWGRKIVINDLTAILGISTRISKVLHASGIDTWHELSKADVGELREILEAAGKRFAAHDPADWPMQARMILDGQWQELRDWQDELRPKIAGNLKSGKQEDA